MTTIDENEVATVVAQMKLQIERLKTATPTNADEQIELWCRRVIERFEGRRNQGSNRTESLARM